MRQQLHLQTPQRGGIQVNRRKSTPVRPLSIAPNPSNPHAAAAQAAAPAPRRRLIAQRIQVPAARQPAQMAEQGQRRSSNSSGSSAEVVDVVADAALARKLAQEEEDRLLAQRLMQEEERAAQVGTDVWVHMRLSGPNHHGHRTRSSARGCARMLTNSLQVPCDLVF
jgi:hypothetical protein